MSFTVQGRRYGSFDLDLPAFFPREMPWAMGCSSQNLPDVQGAVGYGYSITGYHSFFILISFSLGFSGFFHSWGWLVTGIYS